MWTLNCREHGGQFTVKARRGRKPVRCTAESPCSKADEYRTLEIAGRKLKVKRETSAVSRVEKVASEIKNRRLAEATESAPKPLRADSLGLPMAQAAKARLEALGWVCEGKGNAHYVTLSAARGDETLVMSWRHDGTLVAEGYSFWSDVPDENDKPASRLNFNPDEMTDREIVQKLSGMKVTWWNVLGNREETAVVSPDKVTISHAYNGIGDETPADRILTFVDHTGEGFRSFRLGALVKVG